jgi:hypothetical protein
MPGVRLMMKTGAILILGVLAGLLALQNVHGEDRPPDLPVVGRDDIQHTTLGWVEKGTTNLFTGVSVKYHQNGKVSGTMTIRNGEMDGPMVGFHENGQVAVHGLMKKNLKTGYWHYFFPSGVLHKTRIYADTDWVYEARYDESGALIKIRDFRKNKEVEQSHPEATQKTAPSAVP